MNHDDPSEGAVRLQPSEARGDDSPSFSGDERPIVQRVFRKFCECSDTLEEIEGWIDAREETESHIFLPNGASGIVLTPENLDLFVAVERRAIVESREALALNEAWRV